MMKKFLNGFLALALTLAFSAAAIAQNVYFQGSATPGNLANFASGSAGGLPYVANNGTANIASTLSCRLYATGGAPANVAASAYTAQTPVITEFYYAEVWVPAPCTATGIAIYNSATLSGNVKVGIASSSGAILATSASTASAGTTAYQLVPFTAAITIYPGTYYILNFWDNTTSRPNTYTAGSFVANKVTGQTYATGFTAFTPATTFTTALGPVASLY